MISQIQALPRQPWLKNIPSHWGTMSLKRVMTVHNGATPASSESSFWEGDIPWVTPTDLNNSNDPSIQQTGRSITMAGYKSCGTSKVPVGSIIVSTRAPIGSLGIAAVELCFNQGCRGLVGNENIHSKYVFYSLMAFKDLLQVYGEGTTFKELSTTSLADFTLCRPPIEEQFLITHYLDAETVRIDALISAKAGLLDALQDMKIATGLELATRGLDTDVAKRSSGIEWIGKIPSHWDIKRNMFLFKERNEEGQEGYPNLKVSLHTGVSEGDDDEMGSTRVRKQMEDKSSYKLTRKGDVAYNMMRAWQGAIGAVPTDGLVSPAYVVLAPDDQLDPRYFEILARTPGYKKDFERYSYGIASFRWRLYWEGFKEIRTPVPPLQEQIAIVEAYTRACNAIDELVSHVMAEVKLLRELRSSTITDAVLGRIDVRAHQEARHPEEATA